MTENRIVINEGANGIEERVYYAVRNYIEASQKYNILDSRRTAS